MYVNGKGVLKDYKQAVYWCQKSSRNMLSAPDILSFLKKLIFFGFPHAN
jgi:TPR repeat protein